MHFFILVAGVGMGAGDGGVTSSGPICIVDRQIGDAWLADYQIGDAWLPDNQIGDPWLADYKVGC